MSSKGNISRKLAAGKPGTKGMVKTYGEDLLCVRYRYDAEKKVKYKTVEIIVDKGLWDPAANEAKANRQVGIRIGYNEVELRLKVKAAGGIWKREKKVWELSLRDVKALGLMDRIKPIPCPFPKGRGN